MKKLILIISLFSISNAFGQITINNSTGNNIEVTYREFDTATCSATNIIVTTVGPFGTYTAAVSAGSTKTLQVLCPNASILEIHRIKL